MRNKRPPPPRPDRIRSIRGSFSWIDHRFLRQGFDRGLTRLEKLFYFVLIAVCNRDGVSFYSDQRLGELLDVRYPHELAGARKELIARDLIAFEDGIYQVLELPSRPLAPGRYKPAWKVPSPPPKRTPRSGSKPAPTHQQWQNDPPSSWRSLRQLLGLEHGEEGDE